MVKRNTIQKELVLDAVLCMHRHVTADEVYEFIGKDHPSIGKATVYRNLSALADEGKILKIEIPDGPDRFDFTAERHFHVRCIRCGRILDVEMDSSTEIMERVYDSHGVQLISYDILFKGICPDCQQKDEE